MLANIPVPWNIGVRIFILQDGWLKDQAWQAFSQICDHIWAAFRLTICLKTIWFSLTIPTMSPKQLTPKRGVKYTKKFPKNCKTNCKGRWILDIAAIAAIAIFDIYDSCFFLTIFRCCWSQVLDPASMLVVRVVPGYFAPCCQVLPGILPPGHQQHQKKLAVSKNGGTPKWMVYNGKPY